MKDPSIIAGDARSRTFSLRLRLSLLVAGTMLPLLLFAVGLVYLYHESDRDAAFERVLATARGIRLVLDNEAGGMTAGLQVLALSQALQRGDIEGFRRDALAFVHRYPQPSSVVLGDRAGNQLINTRVAAGEPLPPRRNLTGTEDVFRTGRPYYSRFFTGSVVQVRIITVEVPVFRDDEVAYVLSFSPALGVFQTIVEQQRPSAEWTVSIFDQDGVNFARVPNPDKTVGQRAAPMVFAELFKQPEAKFPSVSLEGVPLLTAFTRSPLTGWTVAAGVTSASIEAPLWRNLAITTGIGLVLLAIGLMFALDMATRIARGEALHGLLVHELNHRIKNTLATVQSIAVQTFGAAPESAEPRRKFEERLVSLGHAHSLLSDEKWEGANIGSIAYGVMQPYAGRVQMAGPEIRLPPGQALMLSMILHELATNAAKYGALSNGDGKVALEWRRDGDRGFALTWQESGGPPVQQPTRTGFGSRLIANGFSGEGGRTELSYAESGLVCTIRCPIGRA